MRDSLKPISTRKVYNRTSMQPARIAELLGPFLDSVDEPAAAESDAEFTISTNVLAKKLLDNNPISRGLPDNALELISTYIDILLHWNARINLTAIRNEEEIVTRHFGESLFLARHLFPRRIASNAAALAPPANHQSPASISHVADLGSGAGFPGLPIQLWAPQIALTLIESNHKKAAFLRELTRALALTNANILNVRAETIAPGSFDVITLRAVEKLTKMLPKATALLRPAGRLALLLSSAQVGDASSALPDVAWNPPIPVPQSQARVLLIGQK
jgi:16S rRNA (guanine527-N7)-methyltransferase